MLPFLSQHRGELDVPPAQRLMADLNPTLLESFLNITLAEGKALAESGGSMACDSSRAISLSRLICQNQFKRSDVIRSQVEFLPGLCCLKRVGLG